MAVTRHSLALLQQLRTEVGELADDAVRHVAEAWLAAWENLTPQWQAAVAAAVDQAARSGTWPSSWQLARIPEVASAVAATEQSSNELGATVVEVAVAAAVGAVAVTAAAEPLILASQLPSSLAAAALAGFRSRLLPGRLDTIRASTRNRVTSLVQPLAAQALSAAKQALVRGVPMGDDPVAAGKGILGRLQAAFFAVRDRAINVARTESLDAMRATSDYVHEINADSLAGWTWWASLGPNCCPACWALHGTFHPLTEAGPADHNQGRCVRLVRLKSWSQLGITQTEPADVLPDAEAQFRKLSLTDQLKVMGPARHELWASGDIAWTDLAVLRGTRGWRDSYVPRTVTDLQRISGRRS